MSANNYKDHKFAKYGSMASECKKCGVAFALANDHQGWVGVACTNYTPLEVRDLGRAYVAFFPY
jgi:hypothetical protein